MSDFENVVAGQLRIKGKALDIKSNGVNKKKKKKKKKPTEFSANANEANGTDWGNERQISYLDHLTPAERRYVEQREKIEMKRLAKEASKSHRDRIEEFNRYLANLSEHYYIPKVGPG